MYDASIGRFTGVDPISDQFAHVSVYNYAENEPIAHIDLWGLQKVTPSAAGILFEAFHNARAGLYNMERRFIEILGIGDGSVTRMRINYNSDGGIPIKNPVTVAQEPTKTLLAETGDVLLDILAITPLAELSSTRGLMSGPFLAAKIPSSIIPVIARQFGKLQCVDCATAIMKSLKKEGISGELITLQSNQTKRGFIYSNKADDIIADSGLHMGVLVDGKVYDNIHKNGINYSSWLKDFEVLGGFKEPTKIKF